MIENQMTIEELSKSHADEIFPILQFKEIYKFICSGNPPNSIDEFRNEYARMEKGISRDGKHKCKYWVVRDHDFKAIGTLELFFFHSGIADFAYVFTPRVWGRGLAYAASLEVLPIAKQMKVDTLYATVHPSNVRSINLLRRLDFHNIPSAEYTHHPLEEGDLVFRKSLTDA